MLWIILAIVVPGALAVLWYKFGMMEVDEWEEVFFAWAVYSFFGLLLAIVVNLVLGFALEDKNYDETYELGSIPVIQKDEATGTLQLVATTKDRQNFYEDGTDLIFENSNDMTITIRDHIVFNGWLSFMNFNDNQMIVRIPESAKVVLGQ